MNEKGGRKGGGGEGGEGRKGRGAKTKLVVGEGGERERTAKMGGEGLEGVRLRVRASPPLIKTEKDRERGMRETGLVGRGGC